MATIEEQLAAADAALLASSEAIAELQKQIVNLQAEQNAANVAVNTQINLIVAGNTDIFYLYSDHGVVNVGAANGGIIFPTGTTQERPVNPQSGTVRYNTNSSALEIYTTDWKDVGTGVGGSGGGLTSIFNGLYFENESTINVGFSMANNRNYMTVGPILHTNGAITVSNAMWKII
jgi:hypothetical protein